MGTFADILRLPVSSGYSLPILLGHDEWNLSLWERGIVLRIQGQIMMICFKWLATFRGKLWSYCINVVIKSCSVTARIDLCSSFIGVFVLLLVLLNGSILNALGIGLILFNSLLVHSLLLVGGDATGRRPST